MPEKIFLVEGDRKPDITFSLKTGDGSAMDISSSTATARFRYRQVGTHSDVVKVGTIDLTKTTDGSDGKVTLAWGENDLDTPGDYEAEIEVWFGSVKHTAPDLIPFNVRPRIRLDVDSPPVIGTDITLPGDGSIIFSGAVRMIVIEGDLVTQRWDTLTETWVTVDLMSADVGVVPAGSIIATDVQAALEELDADIAAIGSPELVDPRGVHTIWIPKDAMRTYTSGGPSSSTTEGGTDDFPFSSFDFDATNSESSHFFVKMPKSWDGGNLQMSFTWSHGATTTNFGVNWAFRVNAIGDGDSLDPGLTPVYGQVDDTGGVADTLYISGKTPATEVSGDTGSEPLLVFEISRGTWEGTDTLAVDARLHGVTVYYTTNAATDD